MESFTSPDKTIKGYSALDGARCGTVLSVGKTYYYMGMLQNITLSITSCVHIVLQHIFFDVALSVVRKYHINEQLF